MIRNLRRLSIALVTGLALLLVTSVGPAAHQQTGAQAAASVQAATFPVPRASGMTIGYSGTTDPHALVAAQPFGVRSLAVFDVPTQRWRTYVPGAPTFANSLTAANLEAESIVFAKRTDDSKLLWSPPLLAGPPVVPLPQDANTLTPPPIDGLTLGVAGTVDPAALAAAQLFNVRTINAWDVANQRYDTYIPGAPAIVNTLTPLTLSASDFVWIKADGGPTGAILDEDKPLEMSLVPPGTPRSEIPAIRPAQLGEIIDLGNGSFIYTPPENFWGIDGFTYVVDGELHAFKLIILPVNDPPEAEDDVAFAKPNTLTLIDVLANDTDVEDDPLEVLQTSQPLGGIVAVADGVITYTPLPGFSGNDTFTYEVTDGIAEPGESEDSIGTVTVIVTGAFTFIPFPGGGGGGGGPIAGPPPEETPPPETPFLLDDEAYIEACADPITIDVLANDPGDGSALAIAGIGAPTLGSASHDGATVSYAPPDECTGDDTFTYSVSDASEVEHTANVTVHLGQADPSAGEGGEPEPANQLPVAVDDDLTTFETTPLTFDPLANDSDPDSDALSIVSIGDPTYGTLVDNLDGTYTYTAPQYYSGSVSFPYTITDNISGEASATITTIISRGNVSPHEPIVVYAGGSVTIQVITPSSFVQLESVTEGSHGSVSMNQAAGTITYTPNGGFVGSDWISWTLLFSHGGTAETTVQIDVIN